MRKYLMAIPLALALAYVGTGVAQAASLDNILNGVQVDGKVRAYRFTRQFTPNVYSTDQNAFGLAGILNMHTDAAADGWGFGVTGMTAQSLGLNHGTVDATLMGKQSQYSVLGQLYLQYRQPLYMVRVGDQALSTPWMGGSDSRVLPATYQAVLLQINPINNLHIYAFRETAWKSRTSDNFYQDNLYYGTSAGIWGGDPSYGGAGGLVAGTQRASGTLAVGADYKANGLKARLWYYDFYSFANMGYGEATYTYKTGTGFNPFVGIQGVTETESASKGFLGKVDSQTMGFKVGVNIPHGQIFVAYDKVNTNTGSYGSGKIVSPFTASYATDPLWTTSMIRGLVELGPGHAWKVKATYKLFNNQLRLMAAYAKYTNLTTGPGNSNDTYGDITWFFRGNYLGMNLKGLSLRDRIEVSHGDQANGKTKVTSQPISTFVYNRVMAEYDF